MDYTMYKEHVMDICQSIDISRKESKPNRKNIAQVHDLRIQDSAVQGRCSKHCLTIFVWH